MIVWIREKFFGIKVWIREKLFAWLSGLSYNQVALLACYYEMHSGKDANEIKEEDI